MHNLSNISITELRYIIALSEERHFGKAAKKCFVSQPTLSIAIKKLEDNLGITIFERTRANLIITTTGQLIITQAYKILEAIEDIKNIARDNKNHFAFPLKIGAIYTIGPYLFPQLIQAINKEYPELHLLIEENFTNNLLTKLLEGELDVIIIATKPNIPRITIYDLYTEPLDVILPIDHPWRNKKAIDPLGLQEQILLLLGQGNCFRDQVLSICPSCIQEPSLVSTGNMIITSSLQTIKYMVANHVGISIMPRGALSDCKSINIISKPFKEQTPHREVVLITRQHFSRPLLVDILIKLIKSLHLF